MTARHKGYQRQCPHRKPEFDQSLQTLKQAFTPIEKSIIKN